MSMASAPTNFCLQVRLTGDTIPWCSKATFCCGVSQVSGRNWKDFHLFTGCPRCKWVCILHSFTMFHPHKYHKWSHPQWTNRSPNYLTLHGATDLAHWSDPGYEIDEIDATQLRKHGFQSLWRLSWIHWRSLKHNPQVGNSTSSPRREAIFNGGSEHVPCVPFRTYHDISMWARWLHAAFSS